MVVFQKSFLGWIQDETCGTWVSVENGSRQMVQNPLVCVRFDVEEWILGDLGGWVYLKYKSCQNKDQF